MTKKLSETFGFEEEDNIGEEDNNIIDIDSPIITTPDEQVLEETGIIEHDNEMNEIMKIALDSHKKCLEFGFGVEAKNSSPGLSASTSYLNIALNASKSKVEKRLSLYRLTKENKNTGTVQTEIDENGIEKTDIIGDRMSRNDLMEELKIILDEATKENS